MRITILALGSRGDVQPFIAFGLELTAAGHTVRLAAATDYEPLVRRYGLPFAPLVGSIAELMNPEDVYPFLDAGANPLRLTRRFLSAIEGIMERLVADAFEAAEDAQVLLVSTLGQYPGLRIAARLGIPLVPVHFHPNSATRDYPHAFFPALLPWLPLHGFYNRMSYLLAEQGFWQFLRPVLNRACRMALNLPPLSPRALWQHVRQQQRSHPLILYGYSAHVAPRPSDWDARLHITGYWFLPASPDWQPPEDLAQFLKAGPPPVYVGFGSVPLGRDPDVVTAAIVEALARSNRRGLLYGGWGDVGNVPLPPTVFRTEAVPHDWLFTRVAAVVHHGGAGTTAAALRAGTPSVIVPFYGDQKFWARRVFEQSAGAAPLPRETLSAKRLAKAIDTAAKDPALRKGAARMGGLLAAEDGVDQAVVILNRLLDK